ncbi:hypothetical protein BD309DRAFT_907622 [Dichomitus squalens]|uniref:RRM domain-containing protein n=1 Tax=Dichomitus squalens TaxID=114155 RepID=A0A4Q9MMW6_9APHY|nr:hypothetical protein BD311DRAFT_759904 [Dichomitus squalens]TBU50581.1 hypothetical protein BD309DRAFT_907622 [Dichomitus squalens]TBU61230.1 hypothetical protein BD310DRAFT_873695 [Dichomitus squalens]
MQSLSRPASTSTRQATSPNPKPQHQVNTQTKVFDTAHGRLLCIADIRGRLSALNDLAREANASAIIHTGDFGFFEASSLDRINDRTLRHLTMYSPLIPAAQRNHLLAPENPPSAIRSTVTISLLSEFPLLLSGQIKLQVPVYTVWGACEDVIVLEKFRAGQYDIENLHVLDEATTRCLDIGGVKLRLLGLGGALVPHKMFDNGDGNATIAGGQGTMWTTALQIGELVDTAQRVFDPTETRLLVTHASPGREGIMTQLGLVLKADLTLSAGLHFRYASSYNEFSVQSDFEGLRHKIVVGKEAFDKVWESVKSQVDAVIDEHQRVLLDKALSVVERIPPPPNQLGPTGQPHGEDPAWKNCWNWNLCDAAYGSLILDIKDGRVSAELKSQGFNYAYRRTVTPSTVAATPGSATSQLPIQGVNSGAAATPKGTGTGAAATPVAAEKPLPPHVTGSKSKPSTPPPPGGSGRETPKLNGGAPNQSAQDKLEKERAKRERKKERKQQERAEREATTTAAKEGAPSPAPGARQEVDLSSPPKSGKATPDVPTQPAAASEGRTDDGVTSPNTESTGARTPTSKRPARNPWTIFMRMANPANEAEVREFFGDAKEGITRINYPANFAGRNQKMCYVEFGDEEAMKAGLAKNGQTLNDCTPELKQATDKESRNADGGGRGGPFAGRGRGGRGGFAARGFASAGLMTRGGGPVRTNGDAPSSGAPES